MATAYTVYFAGALFTHKDLLGNVQLAAAVEEASAGRYVCILPQHFAQTTMPAVDIRNQDLKHVMTCDLALFNFDGTDLDSGTVAEFMFAKFLDIPAVLLRTDFRLAGDQPLPGDAWNLMCSFYPRTRVIQLHAMTEYQQARNAGGTWYDITQRSASALPRWLSSIWMLSVVQHHCLKDHRQTSSNCINGPCAFQEAILQTTTEILLLSHNLSPRNAEKGLL